MIAVLDFLVGAVLVTTFFHHLKTMMVVALCCA